MLLAAIPVHICTVSCSCFQNHELLLWSTLGKPSLHVSCRLPRLLWLLCIAVQRDVVFTLVAGRLAELDKLDTAEAGRVQRFSFLRLLGGRRNLECSQSSAILLFVRTTDEDEIPFFSFFFPRPIPSLFMLDHLTKNAIRSSTLHVLESSGCRHECIKTHWVRAL